MPVTSESPASTPGSPTVSRSSIPIAPLPALAAIACGLALILTGCEAEGQIVKPGDGEAAATRDSTRRTAPPMSFATDGSGQVGEQLAIETRLPGRITVAEPFTYTIVVTNTSEADISELVVRERVPQSWEVLGVHQGRRILDGARMLADGREPRAPSTTPLASLAPIAPVARGGGPNRVGERSAGDRSPDADGWLTIRVGDLPVQAIHEIDITARALRAGPVERRLDLDYDDDLRMAINVEGREPSVERTVVDQDTPQDGIHRCEPLVVRYSATNDRDQDLGPVIVHEHLPPQLTTTVGGDHLRIDLGTLAPGETTSRLVALWPAALGTAHSRAWIETPTGTTPLATQAIEIVGPQLDCDLQPVPSAASLDVVVHNHGARACAGVLKIDSGSIPLEVTAPARFAGSRGEIPLGEIPGGGSVELRLGVAEVVTATTVEGSVSITACCHEAVTRSFSLEFAPGGDELAMAADPRIRR